jgi:hypothetical protein
MDPTCLILLNDRTLLLHHDLYGYVHLAAAALLFLILGYVSFALFTRTDPSGAKAATKEKLRRNRIYRVCGIVIWLSLAAYGIYALAAWISPAAAGVVWLDHWRWFLFAVEATCLVAFGFSWLLKGDGVPGLADADAADR